MTAVIAFSAIFFGPLVWAICPDPGPSMSGRERAISAFSFIVLALTGWAWIRFGGWFALTTLLVLIFGGTYVTCRLRRVGPS